LRKKLIIGIGPQSSRTLQTTRSQRGDMHGPIIAPHGASRPKKALKEMSKNELLAHCKTLANKVTRKQLSIEELKKKKGVPNGDCERCKSKDEEYNDLIDRGNELQEDAEKIRGKLIEKHEAQNTKLTEDLKKLQTVIGELKNEARFETINQKNMQDRIDRSEKEVEFYRARCFGIPSTIPTAHQAASVSMVGGGAGHRVQSPASFFTSPIE